MDKELWLKECGARLRSARNRAGYTQYDLARHTDHVANGEGFPPSVISAYEQGSREIRVPKAIILCRALGNITPATLLGISEGKAKGIDPEARHLLELYEKADQRGRRAILQVAESLAE